MGERARGGIKVISKTYNVDCLEYMKTLPDNAFDLAVVDPPYGDGCSQSVQVERERETDGVQQVWGVVRPIQGASRTGGTWAAKYGKKIVAWDTAPDKEYFEQLFRVSRNQIIWGGNYFELPPTRCFLVWRKLTISDQFSMAMCEYAWTSFNSNAKLFEYAPQGKGDRFHPTQKPVALYSWIFKNYAKPTMKILDTHLGSGSSRIAAWDYGIKFFVGCEIDKTYFDKQEERFKKHIAQPRIEQFMQQEAEQERLF